MHVPAPSLIVATLGIPILALTVSMLGALGYALAHASDAERHAALRRALRVVVSWMILTGGLAAAGVLARFADRPPALLLLFAGLIAVSFVVGLGRIGRRLAQLPVAALVGVQAFRLPLDLLMHEAGVAGLAQEAIPLHGHSLDVFSGLTAIAVALCAARGQAPRWLLMAWNLLGGALLASTIVLAVVSTRPSHLGTGPLRLAPWVAQYPFVYVPAVLVVAALVGHVVLTRRLWTKPGKSSVPRSDAMRQAA